MVPRWKLANGDRKLNKTSSQKCQIQIVQANRKSSDNMEPNSLHPSSGTERKTYFVYHRYGYKEDKCKKNKNKNKHYWQKKQGTEECHYRETRPPWQNFGGPYLWAKVNFQPPWHLQIIQLFIWNASKTTHASNSIWTRYQALKEALSILGSLHQKCRSKVILAPRCLQSVHHTTSSSVTTLKSFSRLGRAVIPTHIT